MENTQNLLSINVIKEDKVSFFIFKDGENEVKRLQANYRSALVCFIKKTGIENIIFDENDSRQVNLYNHAIKALNLELEEMTAVKNEHVKKELSYRESLIKKIENLSLKLAALENELANLPEEVQNEQVTENAPVQNEQEETVQNEQEETVQNEQEETVQNEQEEMVQD